MQKLTLTLLSALTTLILTGCSSSQDDGSLHRQPTIPVTISEVGRRDIVTTFETLGTLTASASVDVKPMVDGQVVTTYAREGEEVDEGTPLFKIDPYPYEIKLKEATAQLAIDEASLNVVEKKI